jgi:hypothetical protein
MRRRFIQIRGELVEVGPGYRAPLKTNTDAALWNDRAYQDMNDPRFKSRSQHREYMKRNGLTTIDDFKQHDAQQAKKREEFSRGVDPTRRADLKRAMRG